MLRDKDFVGPDRRLEELLKQRRAASTSDLEELAALGKTPATHSARLARRVRQSARRQMDSKPRPGANPMVLHLIKYFIYNVQSRMEDLQPIVDKYKNDDRLRLGYIYCKLDLWKKKMIGIYANVTATKRRVYSHILYYEYILALNIDVTYTIEFLIYLQTTLGTTEETKEDKEIVLTEDQQAQMQKEMKKYEGKNLTKDEIQDIEKMLESSGIKIPG